MSINIVEVEFFRHPIYNDYAASPDGEIYSLKKDRVRSIKQSEYRNGYFYFSIYHGKICKKYLSHRFIYESINNEILDENIDIDHIDRNPRNNNITNLRKVGRVTNALNKYNNVEVDKLPDDAIKVIKYNDNKFTDLYFSPTTNCLYRYSDDYLFEIPFKSRNRVTIYDIEINRVWIHLNRLREILGYPKI